MAAADAPSTLIETMNDEGLPLTWLLEKGVFSGEDCLRAAMDEGHAVVEWSDGLAQSWPRCFDGPVVFRGCLELADRVARQSPWKPGAYCRTEAFHCSAWYAKAREWLVHGCWELHAAEDFVRDRESICGRVGSDGRVFVRPTARSSPSAVACWRGSVSLSRRSITASTTRTRGCRSSSRPCVTWGRSGASSSWMGPS